MCKKRIRCILVFLPILLILSSCAGENDLSRVPNTWPYMVRIDGVYYYYRLDMAEDYEVEDGQITGYITSVVPENQGPAKDNEANFPAAQDAPYVRYSDDEYPDAILVPFLDGCWHLFAPSEERQENS